MDTDPNRGPHAYITLNLMDPDLDPKLTCSDSGPVSGPELETGQNNAQFFIWVIWVFCISG